MKEITVKLVYVNATKITHTTVYAEVYDERIEGGYVTGYLEAKLKTPMIGIQMELEADYLLYIGASYMDENGILFLATNAKKLVNITKEVEELRFSNKLTLVSTKYSEGSKDESNPLSQK